MVEKNAAPPMLQNKLLEVKAVFLEEKTKFQNTKSCTITSLMKRNAIHMSRLIISRSRESLDKSTKYNYDKLIQFPSSVVRAVIRKSATCYNPKIHHCLKKPQNALQKTGGINANYVLLLETMSHFS